MRPLSVIRILAWHLLAIGGVSVLPSSVDAQIVPGMGGNVGALRGEAAAYRVQVLNILGRLTADLGSAWDESDTTRPVAFYDQHATLVIGPAAAYEGRSNIRKAFDARLRKMRGVAFTIQGFDMSDELAFVRGTMSYEVLVPDAASRRETAGFTMILRLRRGDWIIQSHTIFGAPILPD